MQSRDYIARHRSEREIAGKAMQWRSAGRIYDAQKFNIVQFVEETLAPELRKTQPFVTRFFDRTSDKESPGFVRFKPHLSLHLDRQVWTLAEFNVPAQRFVVAHEIGHVVLHDHRAKAFSAKIPRVSVLNERDRLSGKQTPLQATSSYRIVSLKIFAMQNMQRMPATSNFHWLAKGWSRRTTEVAMMFRRESYAASAVILR